ncbi:MAG: hypothetical protein EZS28_030204 [Streblomastix strix]|uniref:Uncharacterized protein n=1 Tax=Streblomastix strix TaxID=222440 RepID=A0A5J4UVU2_9EUKA|nr:MAG: hypothetical protein EZS28_030204 [Streblomastix strix]
MQPVIEQEKQYGRELLPGQTRHYLNKSGPAFFYPLKNYQQTPSLKTTDFLRTYIPGLLNIENGVTGIIDLCAETYKSVPDATVALIIFAVRNIVQRTEQEEEKRGEITEQIDQIAVDDDEDDIQAEVAIEMYKHFTVGPDGIAKKNCGTQKQATIHEEAQSEITITKTLTNNSFQQINQYEQLKENRCGIQLPAATIED